MFIDNLTKKSVLPHLRPLSYLIIFLFITITIWLLNN